MGMSDSSAPHPDGDNPIATRVMLEEVVLRDILDGIVLERDQLDTLLSVGENAREEEDSQEERSRGRLGGAI